METVASKAGELAAFIREARKDPNIRATAMNILTGAYTGKYITERDARAEVEAIFKYVRDKIRYTSDPVDEDVFMSPQWILQTKAEDCDGKTILLGSLLESVGHPVQIKVAAYGPNGFSHVYLVAKDGNVPLDATLKGKPMGYEAPYQQAQIFDI